MNGNRDDHLKPWYICDTKHRYNRRAFWHDYSSRCYYMVTVTRNANWNEAFSRIEGCGYEEDGKLRAYSNLTEAGKVILKWIYEAERHFPLVEIINSVIMPDHFHIVIFFREKADYTLGNVINFIKSKSTGNLRMNNQTFESTGLSAFTKSFHDRIVFREGILQRLITYVADNPRRHLMRSLNPNLFKMHHVLIKDGLELMAFGNIHLLKDPCRSALIVSSRYTPEERERYEAEWEATAAVGGVFVSPFISQLEKNRMKEYLEKGARIIKIVEHGFWERFKPQGREFELCVAGRLLLIGEKDRNVRRMEMSRRLALDLNDRAREIAYGEMVRYLAYGEEGGWKLKR